MCFTAYSLAEIMFGVEAGVAGCIRLVESMAAVDGTMTNGALVPRTKA